MGKTGGSSNYLTTAVGGTGRHFCLTGDTLVATVSGKQPGKVTTLAAVKRLPTKLSG